MPLLAHHFVDKSLHAFIVNLTVAAPTRRYDMMPLLVVVDENHCAAPAPNEVLVGTYLSCTQPNQMFRELKREFYNKTPSHNTGHGTGAHWH